jgi:hypothetical protein
VVDVGSGEQVICNIAADVVGVVDPVGLSLEVAVLVDGLLGNLTSRVDVALDVVLATLPLPGGGPLGASLAHTVDIGALSTRGGIAAAPDVVVELIAVARIVLVILAKSGLLCGRDGGESTENEGYSLHGGRIWRTFDCSERCSAAVGAVMFLRMLDLLYSSNSRDSWTTLHGQGS